MIKCKFHLYFEKVLNTEWTGFLWKPQKNGTKMNTKQDPHLLGGKDANSMGEGSPPRFKTMWYQERRYGKQ